MCVRSVAGPPLTAACVASGPRVGCGAPPPLAPTRPSSTQGCGFGEPTDLSHNAPVDSWGLTRHTVSGSVIVGAPSPTMNGPPLCDLSCHRSVKTQRSIIREHTWAEWRAHNVRAIQRVLSSEGDPRTVSRQKTRAYMCDANCRVHSPAQNWWVLARFVRFGGILVIRRVCTDLSVKYW